MSVRRPIFSVCAVAVCVAGWVRADIRPSNEALEATVDEAAGSPLEKDERSARAELAVLGAKAVETDKRVIARGRAMYRLVRVGVLPFGAGLGSFLEHAMKVERTRRALEQDLAAVRSLATRKLTLLRKLEEITARTAALELERQAARTRESLDAIDDADDSPRAFERSLAAPASAIDGVPAKAIEARAAAQAQSDDAVDGFRSMKGRLPYPLVGRTEIRRVRRAGAPGPGLEFVAPSGTPVRAVYPGRVAFADRYDPRGSIVILDHGDHFYSLMGDLGTIDVRVGDDLSAGARIGTVGGGSEVLYFEIRRGSSAVDPGPWFGL